MSQQSHWTPYGGSVENDLFVDSCSARLCGITVVIGMQVYCYLAVWAMSLLAPSSCGLAVGVNISGGSSIGSIDMPIISM